MFLFFNLKAYVEVDRFQRIAQHKVVMPNAN